LREEGQIRQSLRMIVLGLLSEKDKSESGGKQERFEVTRGCRIGIPSITVLISKAFAFIFLARFAGD